MSIAEIVVVRARPTEWETARKIRLHALAATPAAFGASLASYEDLTEADWRTELDAHVWLFATCESSPVPVGLAVFYGDDVVPDGAPQLGSMWVEPQWRRRAVAAALVRAAEARALEIGAHALGLWVTPDNPAAADVYARMGYVLTGATKPAPRDASVAMNRMVKVF